MTRASLRLAVVAGLLSISIGVAAQAPSGAVYRPALKPPEFFEPFAPKLEPGHDAFVNEPTAAAIEARLRGFGDTVRQGRPWDPDSLLAADARGEDLFRTVAQRSALTVTRHLSAAHPADRRGLRSTFAELVGYHGTLLVTEFEVVAIDGPDAGGLTNADVRFDLVGQRLDGRVQTNGVWRQRWRKDADGWRIVEWKVVDMAMSHAVAPVFTEITVAALGGTEAFRRQLSTPLDAWTRSLDAVLTRDSNGHHGVSAGDADGDGLDDLYVAQPAGLPNRLFRARGDGTFEDITDRAGVGVLDDTAQSLFADIDNDGDQDLVLATGTQPLLFVNDGTGTFAPVAGAFTFDKPLQGLLTGLSMADYDRDGFLDVYLCVYSYFFGAGEEKAGTPTPYYDARN
ncbi:MAG: VCBS repeat-containing protein, partial [Vicinamibacteraceae bacterium]